MRKMPESLSIVYLGCSLVLMPLLSRTIRHCRVPACFGAGAWRKVRISDGATLPMSKVHLWSPAPAGSNSGQMPRSLRSCAKLLRRASSSSLETGGAAGRTAPLLLSSSSSESDTVLARKGADEPGVDAPIGEPAGGLRAATGVGASAGAASLALTMLPAMPVLLCLARSRSRCCIILALMFTTDPGVATSSPSSPPPAADPAVEGRVQAAGDAPGAPALELGRVSGTRSPSSNNSFCRNITRAKGEQGCNAGSRDT
mmetsp:Transcript_11101/g.27735  ORF Transcript_11101/g.27735 Transcript_11101/m.27735 type:complete len:257 (-) Transcript_11101:8-778(-)